MVCSLRTSVITIAMIELVVAQSEIDIANRNFESLYDHTMVTEKYVYPYVVAILQKETYVSAGAMISDIWILTAADALHLIQGSLDDLTARTGSVNFEEGGIMLPIRYICFHPYYDERKPDYDLAMLRLSQPIRHNRNISPIRFNKIMKKVTTNHFIVTAWTRPNKGETNDNVHRNKLMTVRQMHPLDHMECRRQQKELDIVDSSILLCLNFNINSDRCTTDAGAPVVLNAVLWGIVSSWRPQDCKADPRPSFVNLVGAPNVTTWIYAVMRDLLWKMRKVDSH